MNRSIRSLALAMASLTACLALAPLASADGATDSFFSLEPCDKPGKAGVVTETDYVPIPWWGAYWQGDRLRLAGDSQNATVWSYNYDVAGRCVGGAHVESSRGPSNPCPAPGRGSDLAWTSVYTPEDTYWGPDGHYYVRGYDNGFTAHRENAAVGSNCAPGADVEQSEPTRRDVCVTCRAVGTLP